MQKLMRRPAWLKKRLDNNPDFDFTKAVLREFGINTVCEAAGCPNIYDCFSKKAATVLILGNNCTRDCAFCSVGKGPAEAPREDEPAVVCEVVRALGLGRVVITSVTRDDLSDGGSGQFARVIEAIRENLGEKVVIEVLVPDFKGNKADIRRVAEVKPDIFGHNVETPPRLYKKVRPKADYERSIDVLRYAKEANPLLKTKSGFMVGLGETEEEIKSIMVDLRAADCDMLAIGQYLRPSMAQVEIMEFIHPDGFLRFKELGYSLGFKDVQSGPFVRSSYREAI